MFLVTSFSKLGSVGKFLITDLQGIDIKAYNVPVLKLHAREQGDSSKKLMKETLKIAYFFNNILTP